MISGIARETGTLQIFSRQDLHGIDYSLTEILYALEAAFKAHAAGNADNLRELVIGSAHARSVSHAMLGRDPQRGTVGMTFFHASATGKGAPRPHYASLLLFDDATGLPLAMMDGDLVSALRAPASSALIARECARRNAESVLLLGGGTGSMALPFLATAMPQLRRFVVHGPDNDINGAIERMRRFHPKRMVEISTDLRAEAGRADIVIAAMGPKPPILVRPEWLGAGTLCIAAGHGLHPEVVHKADYRVASSAAEMRAAGACAVDDKGRLPEIDAELPAIMSGLQSGRQHHDQRIFAYSGAMIVADIALGRLLAERAYAQGLGRPVPMW